MKSSLSEHSDLHRGQTNKVCTEQKLSVLEIYLHKDKQTLALCTPRIQHYCDISLTYRGDN